MKLKNCLPLKIRQTVSAIYDDMDYWTGTDNEQLAILRDIVHKQNILINHLLMQTIIEEEVPSNPAGVYAEKMSFQGWFDTAGEILQDMKQGEAVIVYNRDRDVGGPGLEGVALGRVVVLMGRIVIQVRRRAETVTER